MKKNETVNNEVAVVDEEFAMVASREINLKEMFTAGLDNTFMTVKAETEEDKAKLYNALNGDTENTKKIGELINTQIEIKDVIIEVIELADEETGELQPVPRTIIIDSKGKRYEAMAFGVMSSLQRLFKVFGTPDVWETPKQMIVRQVSTKNGNMLKLEMVVPE